MMQYKVISMDCEMEIFEEMVNEAIQDGWRPVGGIALSTEKVDLFTYRNTFYQAMYKED